GLPGFGLIVLDDDLDLSSAQKSAGVVDLLLRQLDAVAGVNSEGGFAAGERGEFADDDVLRGQGRDRGETKDDAENRPHHSLHLVPRLPSRNLAQIDSRFQTPHAILRRDDFVLHWLA